MLARLNHKPYKNQLKNKMVKSKTNNKSHTNYVSVVHKGRENTRKKKPFKKTLQHMKMYQPKKI